MARFMLEKDPLRCYVESSLGRQGQIWGRSLAASQVAISGWTCSSSDVVRHGESLDLC